MLCGVVAAVQPPPDLQVAANAIEDHYGPGVSWGKGLHNNGAGAFVINGAFVYCAEPWIPSGPLVPAFASTAEIPGNTAYEISLAATSGEPVRQISYLMTRYGETSDNVQAAAVALAIWEIRGAGGRGDDGYATVLSRVHARVGAEVVALAERLRSEAAGWTAAIAAGTAEDAPNIALTAEQPYRGTVTVPVGTLTLHIANGVFADGTTSRSWGGVGAPPGTSLTWQGRPPADGGWDRYYRVSFSGTYLEIPSTVKWGDGGANQSTVAPEQPQVKPLRAAYADVDTTWAPEVSSIVSSKFVSIGEPHSDDVIFAAAPASPGVSGDWRWRVTADGTREWMPVKARVTAYGPFLTDPALSPSPEAPVGAPIAAQASFTTDTARDHSTAQRYSFVFEEPIVEQGYYTYKWDVDANDQDPAVAGEDCVEPNASSGCRVLPKNYFFSDGFGAAHETQVGKMEQTFSTKLSTREVGLDESFTDTITLPDMQNWLRDDAGSRLPLTLTGIAYLASGTELAQSAEVPGDAQQLATVRVTTDPQLNGQQLVSEAITIPVSTRRDLTHVTMRWCIVDEDQDPRARGFWEERCDDFGLPDESAKIVHPSVRTEAKPLASTDEPLTDTAVVNGRVPAHTSLVFELFKKPAVGDLKRDADGNATSERWQQHEFDALADAPVCVDENRAARTEAVSVDPRLGEESRYVSPEVRVTENGTYWWVESLIHFDPDSGSETVLLSGICGLTNETTQVADPKTPPPAPEPTPLALAATGSESARDSLTWGAAGIAGLLVAAAAVVLLVRWRRWRAVHPEVTQVRDCEG